MGLGTAALDRFRKLRGRALARIRQVNQTTQDDTLAAGRHVHRVVDLARGHIARLRDVLAGPVGDQDSDLARAIRDQADHVRRHGVTIGSAVAEHVEQVGVVAEQVRSITSAAREIDRLNAAARVLSFNTRIEASRSNGSAVFRTIASEMQQLSRAIESANKTVRNLATQMETALPLLVSQGQALQVTVQAYAGEAGDQIAIVDRRVEELRASVGVSLTESDSALGEIVSESHAALSCLQFQDVCAQQLLQLDTWSAEYMKALADDVGVEIEVEAVANPILGGSDDSTSLHAGEVMVF